MMIDDTKGYFSNEILGRLMQVNLEFSLILENSLQSTGF